ncbi:MAG: ribonuclease P protein component [Ignavibacterium sp.]
MKKYSLSKKERIVGKKLFDTIYKNGLIFFSDDKKIKTIFLFEKNSEKPFVKISVAISKKTGSAVWRNRIKRLIRESYRLNKSVLVEFVNLEKLNLNIVFSTNYLNQKNNRKINLDEIMPDVVNVLDKIIDYIKINLKT